MKRYAASLVTVALLMLMVAFMAMPIKEESATFDETQFLAAGYSYWHGYGFGLDSEAPPLAKMISSAPLLFMDVKLSERAQELLTRQVEAGATRRWSGEFQLADNHFPVARNNWYFWPDSAPAGQEFVYGGANDADKILAAGRWMQVALTVLTGIVIFFLVATIGGGDGRCARRCTLGVEPGDVGLWTPCADRHGRGVDVCSGGVVLLKLS
jgi:hypothetical protein